MDISKYFSKSSMLIKISFKQLSKIQDCFESVINDSKQNGYRVEKLDIPTNYFTFMNSSNLYINTKESTIITINDIVLVFSGYDMILFSNTENLDKYLNIIEPILNQVKIESNEINYFKFEGKFSTDDIKLSSSMKFLIKTTSKTGKVASFIPELGDKDKCAYLPKDVLLDRNFVVNASSGVSGTNIGAQNIIALTKPVGTMQLDSKNALKILKELNNILIQLKNEGKIVV